MWSLTLPAGTLGQEMGELGWAHTAQRSRGPADARTGARQHCTPLRTTTSFQKQTVATALSYVLPQLSVVEVLYKLLLGFIFRLLFPAPSTLAMTTGKLHVWSPRGVWLHSSVSSKHLMKVYSKRAQQHKLNSK